MFNTMTLTKAAGALIGSLLFLMLIGWAGSGLFHVGPNVHAAEGEPRPQAYTIATDSGAAAEEAPAEAVDFATVFAAADAAAGEKVWGKCRACHKLDGSNGVGPHLDGVVNRAVGSVDGFAYSDAMKGHGGNWDPEALQAYLENPRQNIPGNKMSFAGLPKAEDRANLIKYLESL